MQPPKPGHSPPTSKLAPTPGPPGPQPHPPVGPYQLQDTLDPSTSCPRIQPHSPAGQHPRPCSQPCQEPALPTSRLTLDLGPSDSQPPTAEPSSTHQWASTSPKILQGPAACSLATQPWQPTRPGASHAYQTAHSSQPATRGGPMQPKYRASLEHIALMTTRESTAGTYMIFKRPFLQGWGM